MQSKEMTILVSYNSGNNALFYRFFNTENGKTERVNIKNGKHNAHNAVEKILSDFFINKELISFKYDVVKFKKKYLGLKLQNANDEKLNIYFTYKALVAFREINKLVKIIQLRDFYNYAKKAIETNLVEKMILRPSKDNKSSILYTYDNEEYNSLHITRQLDYFYRKSKNIIDEEDLWIICSLIRFFINENLSNHPYYEYKTNSNELVTTLIIQCSEKSYIEIKDEDLITAIEKSRILDDLWLVHNKVIDQMPLQEESMTDKEELKRKKRIYLESKDFS